MQKKSFFSWGLTALMILAQVAMWAQLPDPGGGDIPCGGEFGPCPIPLDGGVTLLLVSGLAIGGTKAWRDRKAAK
ncbi:MAG: hypothetical protein RL521_1643 [Bacteroidota bacterium]|jgi:hypothetical protein